MCPSEKETADEAKIEGQSKWTSHNREKAGLTQKELADKLGVTQPQVSLWETGKISPRRPTLERLSALFGVELDEAATGPELGAWLRKRREELGLTQAQLAKKAGISSLTISFIETGKTESPWEATLKKLERVLGALPASLSAEVREERTIEDFQFLGPFPRDEWRENVGAGKIPSIYVLYDEFKRPVRIGETDDLRRRLGEYERDVWWFRSPTVESFAYVIVNEPESRRKTEKLMIKLVGDHAMFNIQERL